MSDLENLYIKRNEAYKVNDIETVNNITEELNNLYPVKPKSVLCIDGKPVQFEIVGLAADKRDECEIFIKGTPTYLDEKHKNFVGLVLNNKATYARILIRRFF